MAGSQQYRLRLPLNMAHEVETLAQLWDVPIARVLRLCVEATLADPGRAYELLAARHGNVPDSSTPQQRQAAQEYLINLEQINLDTLLAEDRHPLPY
jgi:hypothetical protein